MIEFVFPEMNFMTDIVASVLSVCYIVGKLLNIAGSMISFCIGSLEAAYEIVVRIHSLVQEVLHVPILTYIS